MSYTWQQQREAYLRYMEEEYERIGSIFDRVFGEPWHYSYATPEPVPNTFLSSPVPREGYIDARRDDGCVALITDLVLLEV